MNTRRLNHLAAFVAAVVFFVWGAVWFTVFGALWARLTHLDAPGTPMAGPFVYVQSFVLGWIVAYVTAIALARHPEDRTLRQGVSFAVFMGLGLYATMLLNQYAFEQRPVGLWAIDTGYVVLGFAMIGAIIGGWRQKTAR